MSEATLDPREFAPLIEGDIRYLRDYADKRPLGSASPTYRAINRICDYLARKEVEVLQQSMEMARLHSVAEATDVLSAEKDTEIARLSAALAKARVALAVARDELLRERHLSVKPSPRSTPSRKDRAMLKPISKFLSELSAATLKDKTPPPPDVFDLEKFPYGVAAGQNKFGNTTCPTCGKSPTKLEGSFANSPPGFLFRDVLSCTEYQISGMCQACQDGVFNASEDDDD